MVEEVAVAVVVAVVRGNTNHSGNRSKMNIRNDNSGRDATIAVVVRVRPRFQCPRKF